MAIAVSINGHDVDITPRLRGYVEKKVGRLDRYLPDIAEARVDLTVEKSARDANDRQVAQLTVRSRRGTWLRAEERTADMFSSIDAVLEKMYRQIERYKGKRRRGRGDGAEVGALVAQLEAETAPGGEFTPEADSGPRIVRRKRFALPPMDEEEAIEQMELLGHDNFFVFYNAGTNAISVLYRRKDGNLGLIEPELD